MTRSDYRIEVYKTDGRYKEGERIDRIIRLDDVTKEFAEGTARGLRQDGYRVVVKEQWVKVKSLMTGKEVTIAADTPWCCNPASEAYWSN